MCSGIFVTFDGNETKIQDKYSPRALLLEIPD